MLDSGEITWAVLLDGSLGIMGAFLVAWFAFWLQDRHTRATELRVAVEELREQITTLAITATAMRTRRPLWPLHARLQVIRDVHMMESRVTARRKKSDAPMIRTIRAALSESSLAALSDELDFDAEVAATTTACARLLGEWLENPRAVRRGKITLDSVMRTIDEANTRKARKYRPDGSPPDAVDPVENRAD